MDALDSAAGGGAGNVKQYDGKIRVLLIERMLRYDKVITGSEILRRLESRGIFADRKTIYDDIRAINLVIPVAVKSGKGGGYRYMDVARECEDDG